LAKPAMPTPGIPSLRAERAGQSHLGERNTQNWAISRYNLWTPCRRYYLTPDDTHPPSPPILSILLRPWWQRGEQGRSGFARGGQGHGAPSAASSTNNRKRGGSGLPLPSLSLSPPFPEGERAADVKAVRGVLIVRTFPFLIPI